MKTLSRIYPGLYLAINGALYCLLAWLFLVEPLAWFDRLQINLADAAGYTELRTTYVGLMGGLGVYFVLASLIESWRTAALFLMVFTYAALAAVRAWGIYHDQAFNELIYQLFIIEVIDLLAGILALYCLNQARQQRRNPYF